MFGWRDTGRHRRLGWLCLCTAFVVAAMACRRGADAPRAAPPAARRAVSTPAAPRPTPGEPLRVSSARGTYRVEFTTWPAPIPLNEPFEIAVRVLDARTSLVAEGIVLNVDAAMPEHGHGMNTQPVVSSPASGQYTVRGMLFHMPGRWELYFDMQQGGVTERAAYVVELE
jgi:hypothetical protein